MIVVLGAWERTQKHAGTCSSRINAKVCLIHACPCWQVWCSFVFISEDHLPIECHRLVRHWGLLGIFVLSLFNRTLVFHENKLKCCQWNAEVCFSRGIIQLLNWPLVETPKNWVQLLHSNVPLQVWPAVRAMFLSIPISFLSYALWIEQKGQKCVWLSILVL